MVPLLPRHWASQVHEMLWNRETADDRLQDPYVVKRLAHVPLPQPCSSPQPELENARRSVVAFVFEPSDRQSSSPTPRAARSVRLSELLLC